MATENEPAVTVTILYPDSFTQPVFVNTAPTAYDDDGEENQIYVGDNLLCIYKNGVWRHTPLSSGPFPFDP